MSNYPQATEHHYRQPVPAKPEVRTFDTGATRDVDIGKLDYEAFLSPLVLKRYAEYMHKHRIQADGSLRDGDNWQRGIPLAQYMKSLWRHFMDAWTLHRFGKNMDTQQEENLCAGLFNVSGLLHEILKAKQTTGNPEKGVVRFFSQRNAPQPGFYWIGPESPLRAGEYYFTCSESIGVATVNDEWAGFKRPQAIKVQKS